MPKPYVGQPSGNVGGGYLDVTPNTDISTGAPVSDLGGGASTSAAADAGVNTGTQVNLLGGLISPATVEEARPGGGRGSAVSSFLLRRLSKAERDIAILKAAQ